MNYIVVNGELYHYGVKGMKWGVRKAKEDYKSAKKTFNTLNKERQWGFGMKGIAKATENAKRANSAYADMASAKAKYKAFKAKNEKKAEKAEFKSYVKSMMETGLPGSNADAQSRGRSTLLYNKLKIEKGREYADRVSKKAFQNKLTADIVASTAVGVGAFVVAGILRTNR